MSDSTGPSLVLYAVGLVMLFFSAYASARRRVQAAPEFSLLMAAAAVYAFGYALELSRTSLEPMMKVIRLEYCGIATIPALWLLAALRLANAAKLRPLAVVAMFIVPLVVVAAVWTNDLHHLFYARTWVRTDGPFPVFAFERGPLYWLGILNIQVSILLGSAILVVRALRSSRVVRRRTMVTAVGALGPWLGNVLYILGWTPWGLEPSSFFMALAGVAFYISIFHFGLLELVPAARDRAIESMRDGFLVLDAHGLVVDANQAAGRLLGAGAIRLGYALDRNGPGGESIGKILDGVEVEFGQSAATGEVRRLVAQSFPVVVGRGPKEGSAVILRDVTENAALLARLSRLAGTDELTGLHNRRRFFEDALKAMALARRESQSIAVAIIDIDHFKSVNDRFGHAAGDAALRVFAERLLKTLRAADILCRYGGEEFALLMPSSLPGPALAAIERLRVAATMESIPWEGGALEIRASAGVFSAVPQAADSLDHFLDAADAALYEAKAAGRDRSLLR